MILAHFVLRFTRVPIGVEGAAWLNIMEICKVWMKTFNCWVCSSDPMGVFFWCMHSIWMA